jgi:hypothetical protein
MIGLVPVPVLDHELGHLAVDKELEPLVAHLLAHDGVDAHGGSLFPGTHRGTHAAAFLTHLARMTHATMRVSCSHAAVNGRSWDRTSDLPRVKRALSR